MRRAKGHTVCEKLLIAAFDLEISGRRTFSAEDLVVCAWQRFPDTFGLAGYPDESGSLAYPDSNRVFMEIMGSKPVRKRGFLRKVGTKMYELTESGREIARSLAGEDSGDSSQKTALTRQTRRELERLFASRAVEKFRNNRGSEVTFFDACGFWGISARSSAIQLEGRIANLCTVIGTARKATGSKDAALRHGGPAFGSADLDMLLSVHEELAARFKAELDTIRKRRDERA